MKKIYALLVLFALIFGFSGCDNSSKYIQKVIYLEKAFSVTPNVTLVMLEEEYTKEKLEQLKQELDDIVVGLDRLFNIQVRFGEENLPKTQLMLINENAGVEPVEVDEEIILVLQAALEATELSFCDDCDIPLYDPTIAPVWDLWNFVHLYYDPISDERANPPSEATINSRLGLVDYTKIEIDEENNTVFLQEEGMKLDLGSVVKGYAADKVKNHLIEKGYSRAIIDIGGNVHTLGKGVNQDKTDRPWRLGLQTPYYGFGSSLPNSFGIYELTDQTIVSSGVYERYIKDEDGNEYHHILDPRTGYPFDNGVISVTIVTTNSMLADALSTTVFALGLEEGMELVESLDNVEAVFVVESGTGKDVYISSGAEAFFTIGETMSEYKYTFKGVYRGE